MKKKVNLLLLCVVVGVWGVIIYKLANRYFMPPETPALTNINGRTEGKTITKRDTFILNPLPRDPFLNKYAANDKIPSHSNRNVIYKSKPSVKPCNLQWPAIQYLGSIQFGVKKSAMILLKVNNKLHKAKVGEVVGDVMIKKIYKDSIDLRFNKISRIFYLGK